MTELCTDVDLVCWLLSHSPLVLGISYSKSSFPNSLCSPREDSWVLVSHLVFAFPCKFGTTLCIPSDFHKFGALPLNFWTFQSVTSIGSSKKWSWSSMWISSGGMINASSDRHLLRLDTWKVSWTPLSSSGNLSLYATGPTLESISNGPMYRGLSFPRLPNCGTPFQGETFKSTLSPTWNSRGLRQRSA